MATVQSKSSPSALSGNSWTDIIILSVNDQLVILAELYIKVAPQYNKYFAFDTVARANFTKHFIPLSKEDQIVDIGGGTAHISLKVHSDLEMINPVVCIDPSQAMLNVAQKNGAITIQATAEEFLASKPKYPLKVVLMHGVVHFFTDPDFVFTKLAEYMPDNGVCFPTFISSVENFPIFKAMIEPVNDMIQEFDQLCDLIESKGLKCKVVFGTEPVEFDTKVWYDSIRNRAISCFTKFSDEELEQGIEELEEKFQGEDVIKFDMPLKGFIVTKI